MKANLSNNFAGLRSSAKDYLNLKLDLARLSILEKTTKISVFITTLLAYILAATIFFLFSAAAFVVWYGNRSQDYVSGLLIVMGIVFLLSVLFYFIRNSVITSFFLKTFSKILYDDDDD